MCSQSLKMLGSKKHLDMYLLDIFNKQPIPHCEVRHLVSVLGALLITKQRCSGVTRADVSARGAEVVSAQLIRCVRARRQCTKPGVVWLLRTAPGWRVFLQRKLEHSYTLDIRPLDMTPRHHNQLQLHPSPEQRTVQELEHAALTRAWTRGRHTSHTAHHTRIKFSFLLLAVLFFFKWLRYNAKYKIARVTTAKT